MEYFDIPKYPEAFLKTKLGKKCLFYSILPYLCECDSSRKKGKNSRFNKCKALCSQIKIDMLSDFIFENKDGEEIHLDDSFKEKVKNFTIKRMMPFAVLTKEENNLDIYEQALKEECLFFQNSKSLNTLIAEEILFLV